MKSHDMRLLVVLTVTLLVLSPSEAQNISKCELRDKLEAAITLPTILQRFKERLLAIVVCHVELASEFNTSAVNRLTPRMEDHNSTEITTRPHSQEPQSKTQAKSPNSPRDKPGAPLIPSWQHGRQRRAAATPTPSILPTTPISSPHPKTSPKPKTSPHPKTSPKPKTSPHPRTSPKPKTSPHPKTSPQPRTSPKPKTSPHPKTSPQPKTATPATPFNKTTDLAQPGNSSNTIPPRQRRDIRQLLSNNTGPIASTHPPHLDKEVRVLNGLFQLSSHQVCRNGTTPSPNHHPPICGMDCNKLIDDDISDDIRCVMKIFNQLIAKGFKVPHWNELTRMIKLIFEQKCSTQNPSEYFAVCS